MKQIILVVRQNNPTDVRELQEYLKDGWLVELAIPLPRYDTYSGEIHYILKM